MVKIRCCLCSRRTDKNTDRKNIGADSTWKLIELHSSKNGLEISKFSKQDYICLKCYSSVSHHCMTDRGPNKKMKIYKPVVFETIIDKSVLRSFTPPKIPPTEVNNEEDTIMLSSVADSTTISTSDNYQDSMSQTIAINEQDTTMSSSVTDDFNYSATDNSDNSRGHRSSMIAFESIENSGTDEEDIEYNVHRDVTNNSHSSVTHQCSVSEDETIELQVEEMSSVVDNIHSPSTANSLDAMNEQSSESFDESLDSSSVLTFRKILGTVNTQSKCFICESPFGRNVVPWRAIQQVWFEKRIYIPKSNRTCKDHLNVCKTFTDQALQDIEATKHGITVKGCDFELWLDKVSNLPNSSPCNFEDGGMDAEMYKTFCGISKDDFDNLVTYLHEMRNTTTRSIRNALAMFLMLLRNNIKQELIAFNFSTTQQVVSKTIDSVSAALEKYFVPHYLGYHHITRDQALEHHSIKLTSNVLGQSDSRLYVVADCTYNYIEKPSDFDLQRKTFSAHKKRNLLKPLYIVLPDGYILEAAGPYFCDPKNNDAANIRHHYKHSDLLLFLEEDDCFIFDRGFRDVVDETIANGQSVAMPSLLGGKRAQFTCEEANESRKVTMNRWVVEAVNARVKNVFPFFKHMIEGTYVPKIMRFNRIACAIINKYFPPLFTNKEFHETIATVSKNPYPKSNELKEEIEHLGIQRMTNRWEKASENTVRNFPQLTMEDLKRITLGSYQIAISNKYIEQHMKENSHFGIFIHRENEEIIRAKIQSRFSRAKTHNTWVKFDQEKAGFEAINGYYCSCKVGERTLGCCSHVTSVLRYLGYDRHQPPKPNARVRYAWDAIDCNEGGDEDSSEECDF